MGREVIENSSILVVINLFGRFILIVSCFVPVNHFFRGFVLADHPSWVLWIGVAHSRKRCAFRYSKRLSASTTTIRVFYFPILFLFSWSLFESHSRIIHFY